ncbi:hypothetical protein ATK36_4757 [Amycolatopsis sulphurea]|uniref:Uncharacterized protein n=1 Tax=Amycolatopsis sulphurea TaxID=76022 RepID=A0A2A9FDS1_9PSEU|nr:hypothetical protein ATK36_4757 [Amycolatopsis sulphurea]
MLRAIIVAGQVVEVAKAGVAPFQLFRLPGAKAVKGPFTDSESVKGPFTALLSPR